MIFAEAPADDSRCAWEAGERIGSFGAGACAVVTALLESPSRNLQARGAHAMRGLGAADLECAAPAFLAAFRAEKWWVLLAQAQGVRNGRIAAMLVDALAYEERVGLLHLYMDALAPMGPMGEAALPRLSALASSHWSGDVRRRAAEAYKAISKTSIEAAPYRCPVFVRRFGRPHDGAARWVVGLRSGLVELRSEAGQPDVRYPACERARANGHPGDTFLALGDECITAHYGFECGYGGGTEVWRGDVRSYLGRQGAATFVRREHDVLAIDACCYVMGCGWGIDSLTRGADGRWERRGLFSGSFDGAAAFATDSADGVDVLLRVQTAEDIEVPCVGRTLVEGVENLTSGGFVLLHVDAEGRALERE